MWHIILVQEEQEARGYANTKYM